MLKPASLALWLLWSCAPTAAPGVAAHGLRVLPVGVPTAGLSRGEPERLREGIDNDFPAVVVDGSGRVVTAVVTREGPVETLLWRVEGGEWAKVWPGERAWAPRLASGPAGTFIAWCGRERVGERGELGRKVYLRQLLPTLGEPISVSAGERSCDPDIAVGAGVHLVFEADGHIAYRAPDGAVTRVDEGVEGLLHRRPAVLLDGAEVVVAWDVLRDRADPVDPDYDVVMRRKGRGAWGEPLVVDGRPGIQSAPDMLLDAEGAVVVAYHDSSAWGLVKWLTLRRVRKGRVERLDLPDPAIAVEPSGENQGAEYPAIIRVGDTIYAVTRSAQGALLHRVGARVETFDLTRSIWGVRGLRAQVAVKGAELLVARRARKEAVLERITLEGGAGAPRWVEAQDTPKAARPRSVRQGARACFGDVHMHSALSDAAGTPDEVVARALARGLDFATLTDHDTIVGSRMFPSKYEEIRWLTNFFDAVEGFSALHAFEWTTPAVSAGGSGHQIVYFRDNPALFGSKDGYPDLPALNAALRAERAFTAPHHTPWTGTPWDSYDPAIQRQFEVVSIHGGAERLDGKPAPRGTGTTALEGLRQGHQFGFIGGSDSHGLLWHHGVGRRRDPWTGGLTGVPCISGSREEIWDQMFQRASWATSGVPIQLAWSLQGRVLSWEVQGTRELETITLVVDGADAATTELEGTRGSGSFTVPSGAASVYLRVLEGAADAVPDLAWSSPLFLEG